ncbi:MAG TPA: hypothetical protein VI362_03105 [Ignavibacteriaceae bacterium]|nr:hypothetical protein [Ignavibacteriaceae bacterium]
MGRLALIIIIGAFITYGVTNISMNGFVNEGTENSVNNYSYNRAHDLASSMIDIILMRMANDSKYRVINTVTEDLIDGTVTFSAKNDFFKGDSLVKLVVTGEFNGVQKTITAYSKRPDMGWKPGGVRAAWTANSSLDKTISDMYIDGRNYDLNKNLVPGTGVYGVSTSTNFVNTDDAQIGGTEYSVDYPMTFPEVPNVIEENFNWGGTFPTSPDEILGYPEGTLKAYAQSGVNGSQYATDWTSITLPLSGVTYLELPPGPAETEIRLGTLNSEGILVIHNPTGTTRVKKTRMESTNYFEGIIIGDYMFHFHLDVLGAIMLLSPSLELSQGCTNNRDHEVFYSEAAIKKVTGQIAETLGSPPLYGFGTKRLEVKYWYE